MCLENKDGQHLYRLVQFCYLHTAHVVFVCAADSHRLHHVSGLAWLDRRTLVTTSHDACVKQWTLKI